MKALVVDFVNCEIRGEVDIEDWPNIHEDMFYKTNKGYIPIAYCFKPDYRETVYMWLLRLKAEKEKYEDIRYSTIKMLSDNYRIDRKEE